MLRIDFSPLTSTRVPRVALALAATCLVAACRGGAPAAPPVSADTWAVVDGRNITTADVEKTFQRNRDVAQTLSTEETLTAKLQLLDDLITQDLLLAKARALMIDVSQADVDKAYTETKGPMTDEVFTQELSRRNLTTDDVRETVRRDLIVAKVLTAEVSAKAVVADQEVTDFFNTNKAQFNLSEDGYRLAQIVVTPVQEAQLANRSGDDATTPQAVAAKVKMLMERLQGGAAFGDMAMDFSEDPESAQRGGDLGLVPLSAVRQATPALRDAVLSMEPGRARVVNQGGATAIVLLVGVEKAGQRELSTPGTKEQITAALKARKEQLLRAAYLTALRTDADITNHVARRLVAGNGKL